jgi:hypothetical protein
MDRARSGLVANRKREEVLVVSLVSFKGSDGREAVPGDSVSARLFDARRIESSPAR